MRVAVIYYSLEGNVRTAAERLAARLGAEIFEVRTTKAYPTKGLLKFISGGKDSTFGANPAIEPLGLDPASYDLVVVALPMWAGKVAAPINSLLKGVDLTGSKVALVVSSASGNDASCVADFGAKLGRKASSLPVLSLVNPSKMDAGELDQKLASFAERLMGAGRGGAF